jgi:hypothetical protein
MATYYGTYGQKVQYLASDPSDPQTGQVWYNSTSATLKVRGGAGIQTAALYFGGSPTTGQTELYNGTSWTTNPTGLNTSRAYISGCGLQTAATEEWTGPGVGQTKTVTVS